ncbi:MAG: oligogalacturonate lyase family protein [Acidobacteriia bacterium]|nr:oligogalacturonate lyase family protein [Terriglobia bacterium]
MDAARTRRWFLFALPAAGFAAELPGKGRILSSVARRYADPATEFPVTRLTDPAHNGFLPAPYNRAVARRSNFLLYSTDATGHMEAFRLDLKNGQSRQLTESVELDPASLTLVGDGTFYYVDGNRVLSAPLSHLRPREVYRIPEGFDPGTGFSVAEDGQYAAIVEKKGAHHRIQLIHTASGEATTLAEADEELRDPIPRPRRASVLYRRAGGVWLVNHDGAQNYRLKLADGETGPAEWSPDGRSVIYLNYPADPHQLHNLREFVPDTNEEKQIANTSQFVQFGMNADGSVFVGASGSKASPDVLLLVRSVRRELTLAEHRAKNASLVAPIFAPNSQRIFFQSDRDGKPAIYTMSVEKFVEETDGGR